MRFDDRFLDEIKSRRLSDVIGKSVKLRRQGREYVGLSPFTKERTPSFFVNDDKGFFHDFSSGKHGDPIAFLQETERLSFVEAVERLAGEAGVPLPAPDPEAAAELCDGATLLIPRPASTMNMLPESIESMVGKTDSKHAHMDIAAYLADTSL